MSLSQTEQTALDNLTALDQAIANAEKRAGAKPGRKRLTDEERAARELAREAEKAERKAARAAVRAAKPQIERKTKVDSLREKLPTSVGIETLIDAANVLPPDLVRNLVAHLQFKLYETTVKSSRDKKLAEGDKIGIIRGKFSGYEGVVTKASRTRCHVRVKDSDKELYVYNADVVAI